MNIFRFKFYLWYCYLLQFLVIIFVVKSGYIYFSLLFIEKKKKQRMYGKQKKLRDP